MITAISEVKEPKDMTIEEMADHVHDFIRAALDALNERRAQAYAAACEPLDKEAMALASESADLEAQSQGFLDRMASAEHVKRFEYDQLNMQGKTAEAQAKLAELEKIKEAPAKIDQRRREIAARYEEIEGQKRAALRRTAEDFKEASITLIRACENALARALDVTRSSLNDLEAQVGTLYQLAELTADGKSTEWVTLHRIYCPRVR
jgi:hypothetical protein